MRRRPDLLSLYSSVLLLAFVWPSFAQGGENSPKNPKIPKKNVGIQGTDPTVIHENGNVAKACYEYDHYMVAASGFPDAVGSIIFVKKKPNPNSVIKCSDVRDHPDLVVEDSGEAQYFFGLKDKWIFTDGGTGPEPRDLGVYDLERKKTVFRSSYGSPISLDGKGILTFWSGEGVATPANCKEFEMWKKAQLGAAIETKTKLNLKTLAVEKTSETRCEGRQ